VCCTRTAGPYFAGFPNWTVSGGGFLGFIGYSILTSLVVALVAAVGVGIFAMFMYLYSWHAEGDKPVDWTKYIDCRDPEINKEFTGKKIPMEYFIESYIKGTSDFKGDLFEILRDHRQELFRFSFTKNHTNFFVKKFLFQTIMHSKKWDEEDVTTTYNLGNDFYNAFLGPSMVYTSSIYNSEDETLEEAQRNKGAQE